jgi:hypothetical protein
MSSLPPSPNGHHPIAEIDSRPDDIYTRATQMITLGEEMLKSAKIIKEINDGADGNIGLSIGKIRDAAEDFNGDLEPAGHKYKGAGEIFQKYGSVMGSQGQNVMANLNASAKECAQLWEAYTSAQSSIPDLPTPTVDEPEPDTSDHDDAQQKSDGAYADFVSEADTYDGYYDSWEDAFDEAASALEKFGDGGLDDSWKDELDSFVAAALEVLVWVGLALAVLAIVIGGPLLGAILLAVGALILIGTVWQVYRSKVDGVGGAGWEDLAWAVVAIIPVTRLAGYGSKLSTLTRLDGAGSRLLTKLGPAAASKFRTFTTGATQARLALAKQAAKLKNAIGHHPRKDLLARLFFGAESNWGEISRTNKHTLLDRALNQAVSMAGSRHDLDQGLDKVGQRIYQGLPDLSSLRWS